MGLEDTPSILVFSKIPGLVPTKTRLLASGKLSADEVRRLSTAFLGDTIKKVLNARDAAAYLAAEPVLDLTQLSNKLCFPVSNELKIISQRGATFAVRVNQAVAEVFDESHSAVLLLGSDSPTIPEEIIANSLVEINAGRFVVGPAPCGGFYLLGIPAVALYYDFDFSEVFAEPEMEFERLSELILKTGTELRFAPQHFDIDTWEDLEQLMANDNLQQLAPETWAVIKELGLN